MAEHFLATKIKAYSYNEPLIRPYRVSFDGEKLRIYQPFDVTPSYGLVGTWNLSDLELETNKLYIDFNQKWAVYGMLKVYAEIEELKELLRAINLEG